MSEKRFKLQHINDLTDQEYMRLKKVTDNGELITLGEVVDLLNEQQNTINELKERNAHNFAKKMQLMKENEQLRQQLQEKQEEEKLYANEIVKLNKEVKDNQFLRLGNDY